MAVSPETVGYIDHEQGQIRRIRDSRGGNIHEVFQAPILFGIPEVKLDLEPQAIVTDGVSFLQTNKHNST